MNGVRESNERLPQPPIQLNATLRGRVGGRYRASVRGAHGRAQNRGKRVCASRDPNLLNIIELCAENEMKAHNTPLCYAVKKGGKPVYSRAGWAVFNNARAGRCCGRGRQRAVPRNRIIAIFL